MIRKAGLVCLRAFRDRRCSSTAQAYASAPLPLKFGTRGDIIARMSRDMDSTWNHRLDYTCPPDAGLTVRGYRRGRGLEEYDYKRILMKDSAGCPTATRGKAERVEVKSAQLAWDKFNSKWRLRFYSIKADLHDVLILGVYLPWGLEFWEYDRTLGKGTARSQSHVDIAFHLTAGKAFTICEARGTTSFVHKWPWRQLSWGRLTGSVRY